MSVSDRLAISAVLPVFEEARLLPRVIASLSDALAEHGAEGSEILVVTSAAARDGTPDVAAALAGSDARIRVVEQAASDPGYGRALALGIAVARCEWLFLADADGQFDFADLRALVRRAHEPATDAVLGFRASRRDPAGRRLAGRLYLASIRLALGVRARDVDCAFKLIRTEIVSGTPLVSRTGAVNAELLARVYARARRVVEVPVTHRERPGGRSRFDLDVGGVTLPDPREALAIAHEVGRLASRRLVSGARA